MKKAILILLLLSAFLQGKAQNHLVEASNKLAIDLYQKLKSDNSNLFFSPVSIDFALLALHHGATGKTKKEFEHVLHLDQQVSDQEKNNFLTSHNKIIDSENLLNVSNSLWVNKDFKIREDFMNTMQTIFLSEIRPIDIKRPLESAQEINSWVSNKTNNRIKNIIDPGTIPGTKLMVINTVYFKGEWQQPFNEFMTSEKKFYTMKGKEGNLEFMGDARQVNYFENDLLQAVKIPYKGAVKTFCVLLPKNRDGIITLENSLNISYLDTVFKSMTREKIPVTLFLPKFKLEKQYDLETSLQGLGLNLAFTKNAGFAAISDKDPLSISKVIHKSFFEINEKNTEAAAVTATVIVGYGSVKKSSPPPKVFNADHPFIFMIMDDITNEILFMGKYVGE